MKGVTLFRPKVSPDHRGSFTKLFDASTFSIEGCPKVFAQTAISYSRAPGTLRGMHLQRPPFEEHKLIYCLRGRVYDVIVDLRRDSETFCQWFGVELDARDEQVLHVPPGCAHGFLTLEPESEIFYHITSPYSPEHEVGVRWDDPAFAIEWPMEPTVLSDRDRAHPPFDPAAGLLCESC